MKARILFLAVALASSAVGGYIYDYNLYLDPGLGSEDPDNSTSLTVNGCPTCGTFSKIYHDALTFSNPTDYEVVTGLTWIAAGGSVMQFLRASSDTVTAGTGSYISVELDLTNWNANGGTVPLLVKQRLTARRLSWAALPWQRPLCSKGTSRNSPFAL